MENNMSYMIISATAKSLTSFSLGSTDYNLTILFEINVEIKVEPDRILNSSNFPLEQLLGRRYSIAAILFLFFLFSNQYELYFFEMFLHQK